MDRLQLMSAFVAVAEETSFARAGRRLKLSAPSVTRCVATLEAHLGVKLLDRSTRHVRLTEVGQRYLDDARRILQEIDEAEDAVSGINGEPKGHITLTAPVLFGKMFVTPILINYLRSYPQMQLSALFLDRVVNMVEEGIDVGVRIGDLPDSSLKSLRVGEVRRVICAAPDYLREMGYPATPQALFQHRLIYGNTGSAPMEWRFIDGQNSISIRTQSRISLSTNDAVIEAAKSGFGIARVVSYQVANDLQEGTLVPLLTDYELPPLPIHVLHREGRYKSARVRTLVDMLSEQLRQHAALNFHR
ncbi:MAG TPA: LysR family transcriptional regulator [Pseudomonadales bacterium]|nr:LysR family transcriptional regulator [Pseudomonadales bacterium]